MVGPQRGGHVGQRVRLRRWCRCGGSVDVSAVPGFVAEEAVDLWEGLHTSTACRLTSDAKEGRRLRRQYAKDERTLAALGR